jgi:bla regulator protein BlaR1
MPVTTVPSLIMDAYNVRPDQFTGLPDWANDSDKYQINAKAEGEQTLTPDQARLMLQTLLADRFQLRLHHETRNLPVYELTIAKSGLKLKLTPERTADSQTDQWWLILMIEAYLDYPVVDKTGLTGFIPSDALKWDDAKLREEVQRPAGLPPGVPYRGLAPSIFHEVEAQFGLSLKKVNPPSDFLVIDHVERPSKN